MRISDRGTKTRIPSNTRHADAIRLIIKAFEQQNLDDDSIPERNDIKTLWVQLQYGHKRFLHVIAQERGAIGISQLVLEKKLGVDWQKLRGIHNGLARISAGLEMENPIRTTGYNRANRRYNIEASAAKTIASRWRLEQQ